MTGPLWNNFISPLIARKKNLIQNYKIIEILHFVNIIADKGYILREALVEGS